METASIFQELHERVLEAGSERDRSDSVACGLDAETTENGIGFARKGDQIRTALECKDIRFSGQNLLKLRVQQP